MVGYEEKKDELQQLGVSVFAASVDTGAEAGQVADEVSFAIGEGVRRDIADALGAWWEDRRDIIQPSQFLMRGDGTIIQSTYSDGPLGRILAEDAGALVNFLIKQ